MELLLFLGSAMKYADIEGLPPDAAKDGMKRWTLLVSDRMMLTVNEMGKGETFPSHSHLDEEAKYVIRGSMEVRTLSGTIVLRPGTGCLISPNEAHSARVLGSESVVYINVFCPPREEYLVNRNK
jgi:quercetin dioxygenase-like cupin family protein